MKKNVSHVVMHMTFMMCLVIEMKLFCLSFFFPSQPFKVQVFRSSIEVQVPMELKKILKIKIKVNPIELKTIASKLFHLRK